jgi:hypothetical protein
MLSRRRMLREYPTDHNGGRVCVEVVYSKGDAYARGYWLHIYPCRIENGMRIIPMGQGGRRLIATAKRLTKKEMEDAAWKAEGWLLRDDPSVRASIAACGNIQEETAYAND